MRSLFLVLAKLIGVFQVYRVVSSVQQFIFFLVSISQYQEQSVRSQFFLYLLGFLLDIVLSLVLAWVLLFRTDWLADKLKIQNDATPAGLTDDLVLRAGVRLIGIYVAVLAVPELAKAFLHYRPVYQIEYLTFWSKMTPALPALLKLGLGVFLALKSDIVVKLISGKKGRDVQTDVSAG